MAKKNRDEEEAIKRAREIERKERETDRKINELNKAKDMDAQEKLRRLLDDE